MDSIASSNVVATVPASGLPSAESSDSPKGKAFAAISAAIIWPGLGHLVAGRVVAAFGWCALWMAILAGFVITYRMPEYVGALGYLLPLAVLVRLVQMFDAGRVARKSKRFLFHTPQLRFFAGVFCSVIAFCLSQNQINWLMQNCIEVAYSPTPSMSPAISVGDLFLTYKAQPIHRWDIVGLTAPETMPDGSNNLIKRVVGLPGEKIEIRPGALFINDQPQALPDHVGPYIAVDKMGQPMSSSDAFAAANGCWGRPITLGADEYFVLGDNSSVSGDARFWRSVGAHQPGALPRDQILSRAVYTLWPPSRIGPLK
jgi:signal peptidase I